MNGSASIANNNQGEDGSQLSSDNGEDDFGDFESHGESLLTLVQPELVSLSQNWLAALKDHALLSLPPGKKLHDISCLRILGSFMNIKDEKIDKKVI